MDAAKKSFELQAQVRQNAEECRTTLKSLYDWEKEIKEMEQKMQSSESANEQMPEPKTLPIRSHVADEQPNSKAAQHNQATSTTATTINGKPSDCHGKATTPVEKSDIPLDPMEKNRQAASEIKDRGNSKVKLGLYKEAIFEYTKAIEIYPYDPIFYCNRALCHLKMERYDECIADCERAIAIDQRSVKAYYRRMQAEECLGNNLDALKDCTIVLMIEPKNLEAKNSLERINERLRTLAKSTDGPNFSPLREDMLDILPIEKPPYKRSNKPLYRVPIMEVVGPRVNRNANIANFDITDEEIDKIFNSNCGPIIEIKKSDKTKAKDKSSSAEQTISSSNIVLPKKQETAAKSIDQIETKKMKTIIETEPPLQTTNKMTTEHIKKSAIANSSKAPVNDNTLLMNAERPLPPAPTSTGQFYSNWKELTMAQKYQYLKSIEISKLCKILGAGFDSDTLSDILLVLRDYYVPNNESTIAATLFEIGKNPQLSILSLLMSSTEREVLREILNSLNKSKTNSVEIDLITKNFHL